MKKVTKQDSLLLFKLRLGMQRMQFQLGSYFKKNLQSLMKMTQYKRFLQRFFKDSAECENLNILLPYCFPKGQLISE